MPIEKHAPCLSILPSCRACSPNSKGTPRPDFSSRQTYSDVPRVTRKMESSIPPGFDLSKIPIGSPPTGVAPNFVNPQTLAPTILAVSIVILVLTIAVVFLRLYARLYSHSTVERKLGYDDCTCHNIDDMSYADLLDSCIVATVLLVGLTGLTINSMPTLSTVLHQ